MSTNIVNIDPYLRTTWHFTKDDQLMVELTRSFNEVAIVTNMREIGTYALNLPAITGKQFFMQGNNRHQQSIRTLLQFTATGNVAHNIMNFDPAKIVGVSGSFTDGTNAYGVVWGSSVAIAGQVSVYLTSTNAVIQAGAGSPAIVSGILIVEWLSS